MILQRWSYVGVIERLKVNDIIFFLSVFEIGRYERLCTCVYKGVKVKSAFKSPLIFVFITMAHTAQNSSKVNLQRNLQIMNYNTKLKKKKIANFINNQLECFFFIFFSSKKIYL